jgi:hypothetical protein
MVESASADVTIRLTRYSCSHGVRPGLHSCAAARLPRLGGKGTSFTRADQVATYDRLQAAEALGSLITGWPFDVGLQSSEEPL